MVIFHAGGGKRTKRAVRHLDRPWPALVLAFAAAASPSVAYAMNFHHLMRNDVGQQSQENPGTAAQIHYSKRARASSYYFTFRDKTRPPTTRTVVKSLARLIELLLGDY